MWARERELTMATTMEGFKRSAYLRTRLRPWERELAEDTARKLRMNLSDLLRLALAEKCQRVQRQHRSD